ncbi:MAG: PKD domain-containing protein [Saprospiraceae bacterium]
MSFQKKQILFLLILIWSNYAFSQKSSMSNLTNSFYTYDIISVDANLLSKKTRNNDINTIEIPKGNGEFWQLELFNSNIISDNYLSRYADNNGTHIGIPTNAIPTKGIIVGDDQSTVSLTFNDGFIYGYIRDVNGYCFIEPLSYYTNKTKKNQFVVYHQNDLKPTAPKTCGITEMQRARRNNDKKSITTNRMVGECFEVDYAIANDFLMFQEFGSVASTENHAIGVTNNIQTNYDDDFGDELQFIIVEQFTPTSSGADPWTNSTNAGTVLDNFTDWGPSGFLSTHDIGSLWTDRNFDGSTIGIAWLGVVCTSSSYNALENFTNNANTKRVMVAHEFGHNFSSDHDPSGSPTIMAPTVNNTTTWSSQSINAIDNHIASRWCLSNCSSSSVPPVASFDFFVADDCTPAFVQYTSTSSGADLTYNWEFPGGAPSFSQEENPLVTYNLAGIFSAILTVTNTAGSNEVTQSNIFEILQSPEANFSYAINGTEVSFFNFSSSATFYEWDFGDGQTSNLSDPVHDFLDDGVYTVILTASNDCSSVTNEQIIVIANAPTASFSNDISSGCATLEVQFTSTSSSNVENYQWTFEGGTPNTSTMQNPQVSYDDGGNYDVTLMVSNSVGDDEVLSTDYIIVLDDPISDYTFVVNGSEVTFSNMSQDADSYSWNFGDGSNISTDQNPVHLYSNDGTYDVMLSVENECGTNTVIYEVVISNLPVASIQIIGNSVGCNPLEVAFESTSTNDPDSYLWTFVGGTPNTSSIQNPIVMYNQPGIFDVTLTVSNSNGNNTLTIADIIVVNDVPNANFTVVESGLTIMLTDMSIDADNYEWDFGDGGASTLQNPSHTYSEEGDYNVVLTTINECGTNSKQININNYSPVTASFSTVNATGCTILEVEFFDMSSDNVIEWFWEFEGGLPATSIIPNPIIAYNQSGTYDVKLTVSHPESSETITFTDYIFVDDQPVASFDYFDDLFDVTFTNNSTNADTYLWDFGDGVTSSLQNPVHTYQAEGTYNVILTSNNDCGSNIYSYNVVINNLPSAAFNAAITKGCGPLVVDFNNASSSNVTSYNWTFVGGTPSSSTSPNPQITYEIPGFYDVQLEVVSPAGNDVVTLQDYIQVLDIPIADFEITLNGNEIIATNTSTDVESFSWTVNNEEINTDVLTYTLPNNGDYNVVLNVSNECGQSDKNVDVNINVYPQVVINDLPITVCIDDLITLNNNSSNADTWSWILEGAMPATSDVESPVVSYNQEGVYDIKLEVSNEYGSESILFSNAVEVLGLPVGDFNGELIENQIEFTTNSQNVTSYLWNFGDGETSTLKNPTHIYSQNGEYTVKLILSNECGNLEITNSYTILSNSIFNVDQILAMVYPNPATNRITIEIDDISKVINYKFVDIAGKLILSGDILSKKQILNVSHMPKGTYILQLSSENLIYHKKIVLLD